VVATGSPLPVAASAAPSASPVPLTQDQIRKAAKKAYVAAVTPRNKAINVLWQQYRNKTSLSAWRQYCAKNATLDRNQLLALKKIVWPTDTAADAKVFMRNVAGEEAHLRSCAKSKNFASWNDSYALAGKAANRAVEAANLVRLDLGLASVSGG
jgi:hypothetical protein